MDKEGLLSVIIPVYNVEAYLRKCLDSVKHQTYSNLEVILVDDGSTDASGRICEDYADADSRFSVLHKENGGAISARKAGLKKAAADYVIFADADDWMDADMYERLMELMLKYQVDAVISGHCNDNWEKENPVWCIKGSACHRSGLYQERDLDEAFYAKLMYGSYGYFGWGISPSLADKLCRRDAIYPYLMKVDDRIRDGDDSACVYPMLANLKSIYISDLCCYHHTFRQDSLCHTYDFGYFKRLKLLQENLETSFESAKYRKVLLPQLKRFIFEMFLKNFPPIYQLPLKLSFKEYLFPFHMVEKGSRIILYGAGSVGRSFYRQACAGGFCSVILWADQNWRVFQYGTEKVESPEMIRGMEADAVVIAVADKRTAEEIKEALIGKYFVPREKILWSDSYGYHSRSIQESMGF